MLRQPSLTSTWCRGPVGVLVVLALAGLGRAAVLPAEGSGKLKEQWQSKEIRDAAINLSKGLASPDASNMVAIDVAAKWYIYRVTWLEYQREPVGIDKLMKELRNELESAAKNKPGTTAYLQLLTKKMVACARDVVKDDLPIARINGARMLAILAEHGYEESVDALVDVVEDPGQIDAVKHHALKGLKEFFSLGHRTPPVVFTNKDRENRAILALIKFVERQPKFGPATTKEEAEAFRIVRREAIRALAQTKYPAVEVKGKLEGRTAQTLLTVVAGALFPEPRLDEKVAAAAGVMRLKSELTKGYQPDYAVRFVGNFFVELGSRYQNEKEAGRADKQPWKVYAAELGEALDAMRADTKNSKTAGAYVAEFHNKAASQIRIVESGGVVQPVGLFEWIRDTPIKSTTIYEGVPDAVIKPPTVPGAEAATEKPPETGKK